MSYRLVIPKPVRKQLASLPSKIRKRIDKQLVKLEEDPYIYGSEKMRGTTNEYRIRVGDYRVRYEIHDQELIVLLIRVQHRKDVHRD